MTRAHKFRVWDNKAKRMVPLNDFTYLRLDQNGFYCLTNETPGQPMTFWTLDDTVIMQWTGLRDKHDVEIYENDIVDAWSAGSHATGVITWGTAGFFIKIPPPQAIWHLTGPQEVCAVIGNTLEHPELVKEADEN